MLSAFVGNVKFDDGKANVGLKLARRQAYLQQYLHRVGKEGFLFRPETIEVSDARDCSALCFTSRTVPSMQLFICMKGDLPGYVEYVDKQLSKHPCGHVPFLWRDLNINEAQVLDWVRSHVSKGPYIKRSEHRLPETVVVAATARLRR